MRLAEEDGKAKKLFVMASHGVGKSHLLGGLVNWHFDTNWPSITLTTAPTAAHVKQVLWGEVRDQRHGRPGLMPEAPEMRMSPKHWAAGFTALTDTSMQGRHEEQMLMVGDEAVGIPPPIWTAFNGMSVGPGRKQVMIMNPTDTTSQAYIEFCSGNWDIFQISALNHPNILAELQNEMPPFPKAVRLTWVYDRLRECCEETSDTRAEEHFEFPPGSGKWYKPNSEFESRVMGRWPSTGTDSIWSMALWNKCMIRRPVPQEPLSLGVDVSRSGSDKTVVLARRGGCFVGAKLWRGKGVDESAREVKGFVLSLLEKGESYSSATIVPDDSNVGGGFTDNMRGWNVIPFLGNQNARQMLKYPNARSEAWFCAQETAKDGLVDLSRLPKDFLMRELFIELMAPKWGMDGRDRREVEEKKITKKRVKRSPDSADAFNMCLYHQPRIMNTGVRVAGYSPLTDEKHGLI